MSHSSALGLSLARSTCFCWVLRVQGFHNSRCERTDALVVRPGLGVCLALMALSHGLKLTCSGFNFWLNPLFGFPPVSVFSIGWCQVLPEMPGAFGICWNNLSCFFILFFFFLQVGEAQAVLAEAWLICGSSSVLCITFSFCTGYRISYTFFVCVDPAPRQHRREKRIREYKQHVSIWKMCFFAWGISLLISALLWSRWKYLNKYWMDYHEILHSV